MIGAKLDASGAKNKLKQFQKQVASLTGARCIMTPTDVIYWLCEQKGVSEGDTLLDRMPNAAKEAVRQKWLPKVEEASKASVRRLTGTETATRYEADIARAWRYGAYLYADRLWAEAKAGAWGRIAPGTEEDKARDVGQALGRQFLAAKARGRRVREATEKATGWALNFGVRAIESGRRWYEIQKGRRSHGNRSDISQEPPVIEVKMGSRVITSQ